MAGEKNRKIVQQCRRRECKRFRYADANNCFSPWQFDLELLTTLLTSHEETDRVFATCDLCSLTSESGQAELAEAFQEWASL